MKAETIRQNQRTGPYTLDFADIDPTSVALVGGKGANLAELTKIAGINVPDGFCLTTEAFQTIMGADASIGSWLDALSRLKPDDRQQIRAVGDTIRKVIEGMAMPLDMQEEVISRLARRPEKQAYAIRSSATAEDTPTASFAGQHETFLNIVGPEAILQHIRQCWASLFTERAIVYRLQNGFDHHRIHLAVLIQKMIIPQVAGILFTADPVTSHRKLASIDASFGLGEAVVSGLVNADNYRAGHGKVLGRTLSAKKLAIQPLPGGGTEAQAIEPARQNGPALSDEQILQLDRLGRTIEAHFGRPQDIEWCLLDNTFHIVQSRPITTLYPIPEAQDRDPHVYVSVGHQQMMTDAMKPLGLSFFLLTTPAPMRTAGGRLFVDITLQLKSPASRTAIMEGLGKSDPLIKDALLTLIERDFIKPLADGKSPDQSGKNLPPAAAPAPIENDPGIVTALIKSHQTSIAELKRNIQTQSGPDLFDFILDDIQTLRKFLFDPQSLRVIMAAVKASAWINESMNAWIGEKNAADTLSQSVPNNVTSAMGLALLDVADAVRPYPQVIDYLRHADDANFLEGLDRLEGGKVAQEALQDYLSTYGMRCSGEIDITKARWGERPTALVPMILSNIKNQEPHASTRKFEQGRQAAFKKEREILDRLKALPDGEQKADETKSRIDLIRNFIGYREYPKYGMVSRYFVYKQALLQEAEKLTQANVIHENEDIYYLTFEELREVVRTHKLNDRIIRQRKDEFRLHEKLNPPRVITSDGEIIAGQYQRPSPSSGILPGLPVSLGVREGRARVILKVEEADLEADDILVTTFTDPSWTPLFVSIKALVTEVGGLMTHGAVIAREYGLPAVVGVENATKLIQDGQRIRVNGTDGYVEIL